MEEKLLISGEIKDIYRYIIIIRVSYIGGCIVEIEENAVYTREESQELLKVSQSTMMRLIKKGIIRAAKVGKQYRIMGKELLRVVSPELEDKVGKIYNKGRNWVHEGIDENIS